MFILVGEGKFDSFFFSKLFMNIQEKLGIPIKFHCSYNHIKPLMLVLSNNIIPNTNYYSCFFWGNNGKGKIIPYSFKILRHILGQYNGNSDFLIIRDEDNGGLGVLSSIARKLEIQICNPKKYSNPPIVQIHNEGNISIQRKKHKIHVQCKLVPKSLEYQICKEEIERHNLDINYNSRDIHEVLQEISIEFGLSQEELIMRSVEYLEETDWCKEIEKVMEEYIS